MPDPDFFRIRALEGDQKYAFEEFCAHLARRDESVPAGSRFSRLDGAGGDGGVECYWTLPSGAEWGWQSKFLRKLDKAQLTSSVQTALKLHPRLERYTVCLPFNFTGRTGRGGKDQEATWNEYVAEWNQLASNVRMSVRFEHWTQSELLDRLLVVDPSGGRLRFWFDTERLSHAWFHRHLSDAAADAGPRYHPELNVAVPISKTFDMLGQTPRWKREQMKLLKRLDDEVPRLVRRSAEHNLGPAKDKLDAVVDPVRDALAAMSSAWDSADALDKCRDTIARAEHVLSDASLALQEELEAEHGQGVASNASFRQWHAEYMVAFPAEDYDLCQQFLELFNEARELMYDPAARATSEHVVLVTGSAGAGKTHAICDAGQQRLSDGLLSIVILGEKLVNGEVMDQVRRILGLPGDIGREELLAALDSAGEATHSPLVLFIDALNERTPRSAWKTELGGLVNQVRRYMWIRLCLSCRTTYLHAVLPDELDLPQVEHRGFVGVDFDACFTFFAHWGLEPPSVPMLQPEYSNPLFLRMICTALANDSECVAGTGEALSLSDVVMLLLRSTETLAAESLDVDRRQELVSRAIQAIIGEMVSTKSLQMAWSRADVVVNSLLPGRSRSASLLEFLIAQGLLTEVWTAESGDNDHVRFGFERLGEYLYVKQVLSEKASDVTDELFSENGPLHIAGQDFTASDIQGLAEALAILLPERTKCELPDLTPPLPRGAQLIAVVNSLSWRNVATFTARTKAIIFDALQQPPIFDRAMEQILGIAPRAGHPLGVEFFHSFMQAMDQAKRDQMMCRFLHLSWESAGNAKRLSEWAVRPDLGALSRNGALAWAQTLLWFCSAADRRVRDQATMGVVALMQRHTDGLPDLIGRMSVVDDDYVIERVYLSAYGALVRGDADKAVDSCATAVWRALFSGQAPANALIRDHGRSIVELAVHRGVLNDEIDIARCRPPYESELPVELRMPPNERGDDSSGAVDDGEPMEDGRAARYVRFSVHDGDFERYTMVPALQRERRPSLNFAAAQQWVMDEVRNLGIEQFDNYDGHMAHQYGTGRGRPTWAERVGKKYQWIALYRLIGLVSDNLDLEPDAYGEESPADGVEALQAASERNIDPTMLVRATKTSSSSSWWSPVGLDFRPTASDAEWLDRLEFPDSKKLVEVVSQDAREWLVLRGFRQWDSRTDDEDYRTPHRYCWMHLWGYLVREQEAGRAWHWLRTQNFHGRWMPEPPTWLPSVFAGEYPWAVQARVRLSGEYTEPTERKVPVPFLPVAMDNSAEFECDAYHEETFQFIRPTVSLLDGSGLTWNGLAGYERDDRVVFFMPNFADPGPSALLVARDWMEEWLRSKQMRLLWAVLSERHFAPGSLAGHHELGYAVHSRAHQLYKGKVWSSKGVTRRIQPSI